MFFFPWDELHDRRDDESEVIPPKNPESLVKRVTRYTYTADIDKELDDWIADGYVNLLIWLNKQTKFQVWLATHGRL